MSECTGHSFSPVIQSWKRFTSEMCKPKRNNSDYVFLKKRSQWIYRLKSFPPEGISDWPKSFFKNLSEFYNVPPLFAAVGVTAHARNFARAALRRGKCRGGGNQTPRARARAALAADWLKMTSLRIVLFLARGIGITSCFFRLSLERVLDLQLQHRGTRTQPSASQSVRSFIIPRYCASCPCNPHSHPQGSTLRWTNTFYFHQVSKWTNIISVSLHFGEYRVCVCVWY